MHLRKEGIILPCLPAGDVQPHTYPPILVHKQFSLHFLLLKKSNDTTTHPAPVRIQGAPQSMKAILKAADPGPFPAAIRAARRPFRQALLFRQFSVHHFSE